MPEAGSQPGVLSAPDQARVRALLQRGPRPSERWPALYPMAVWVHRMRRRAEWARSSSTWAATRRTEQLAAVVCEHDSPLLRALEASAMHLQHNKVANLRLAAGRLDGLLLRPGETFSFNRVVGPCSRWHGYLDGMQLFRGEVVAAAGGGVCQLANMVHWLVLHSELTVTERSEHTLDPFPDDGRTVPWGTGCTIVYNYVDLQVRNDTGATYQLRTAIGETHLHGELRCDRQPTRVMTVYAEDERFYRVGDRYLRANRIRRRVADGRTGQALGEELVRDNLALVRYVPQGVDVIEAQVPSDGLGLGGADPLR